MGFENPIGLDSFRGRFQSSIHGCIRVHSALKIPIVTLQLADYGLCPVAGRFVLISGASTGIGRAVAKLLVRAGARVAAMARSKEKLDTLRVEADAGPGVLHCVSGDVQDEAACRRAVAEALERFGRLDILINNAAVGFPVQISTCSTDDYRRTMATNMDGVFFLTRETLASMRRQGAGHIIMISSDAGVAGSVIAPIYSTSKHALEGFTASLRLQLQQWHAEGVHIRLTNIWPGSVASDYWGKRDVPRETFMTCEEMARFILQAASCAPQANVTDLRVEQFKFAVR